VSRVCVDVADCEFANLLAASVTEIPFGDDCNRRKAAVGFESKSIELGELAFGIRV
jgi:hypothetical protein